MKLKLLTFLMLGSLATGCASETDPEGTSGDSDDADITTGEVTWRAINVTMPADRVAAEEEEFFSSMDSFRYHFGKSCGWFCNDPYRGAVPFSIPEDRAGSVTGVVYVSRPVPANRDLVIKRIERHVKWFYVETCTRPGTGRRYAFASAAMKFVLPILGARRETERGTGLEACP